MAQINDLTELGEAIADATADQLRQVNDDTTNDAVLPMGPNGSGSLKGHSIAEIVSAINGLVLNADDKATANAVIVDELKEFVIITKPPQA